ncbi:unnamed protein product [Malus baccata var. baccata]
MKPRVCGGSRVRDDQDKSCCRAHGSQNEQTTGDGAGEAESKAESDDDGGGGCGESGYGFGCESRRLMGDARVGWATTMESERRKG